MDAISRDDVHDDDHGSVSWNSWNRVQELACRVTFGGHAFACHLVRRVVG